MDRQPDLPFRTSDLERVGGTIKSRPEDFEVVEIPLYEPNDDGQHVYVRLTRQGEGTRDVVERLAGLFDVPESTVGYAGLKDRVARATQTFSLDSADFARPKPSDAEVAERIAAELGYEVEYARRHRNKLRRGHHIGNRFSVRIRDPRVESPEDRGRRIADALVDRGVPNFYGSQRFGRDGDNAERGRRILEGEDFDGPGWKRRLMCNAYQSELFNRWLTERIEREQFDRLLRGDVAKKVETGGLFEVEDREAEQSRFEAREITFTGPIYGGDLWEATGPAGELEGEILEEAGRSLEEFGRAGLSGSRRRGRIHLEGLEVDSNDDGLVLDFELPKGGYATVVLREFL